MLVEEVIPVAVIVDKKKAASPWIDHIWVPARVVTGLPEAQPMTLLARDGENESYYAGSTSLVFASTETANYRDNLITGQPKLWVVLRMGELDAYVSVVTVTADPAEGEAHTESGSNIVEPLPMPPEIAAELAAFVDRHHVEREFFKRKRDRVNPDALAHRRPGRGGEE
ncbi:MAG: DUF3305 domain-containing protein [Methylobacterium sp.]|jgi:hypothetical protein|nr:DUF3305 domain-containing protein [Methylobacterium sp.]MCA3604152.1 DUF3305 domain-containing protein [Methylobacterium sp.]MCA3611291.1 DUF3305 domain-containing protein [Methylobacterium sp.]MCA3615477.1 DUF3305 domain-containing protein [Methylobacterium sp.]MCA3624671.1 DUF3305 domain-containing protein [Methylobacterium sp.]